MKIYVASSWRNKYQPDVVAALRAAGHEPYDFRNPAPGDHGFSWSSIDENWRNWTTQQFAEALKHPIAEHGFGLDYGAMQWSEGGVLVLPSGRSAHDEAGWMSGAGKPVIVYVPAEEGATEPELMYKLHSGGVTDRLQDVLDWAARP